LLSQAARGVLDGRVLCCAGVVVGAVVGVVVVVELELVEVVEDLGWRRRLLVLVLVLVLVAGEVVSIHRSPVPFPSAGVWPTTLFSLRCKKRTTHSRTHSRYARDLQTGTAAQITQRDASS
jgi:hypothetical protein